LDKNRKNKLPIIFFSLKKSSKLKMAEAALLAAATNPEFIRAATPIIQTTQQTGSTAAIIIAIIVALIIISIVIAFIIISANKTAKKESKKGR
jgi:threonine/homoserine/homoserine lactone efflux protein